MDNLFFYKTANSNENLTQSESTSAPLTSGYFSASDDFKKIDVASDQLMLKPQTTLSFNKRIQSQLNKINSLNNSKNESTRKYCTVIENHSNEDNLVTAMSIEPAANGITRISINHFTNETILKGHINPNFNVDHNSDDDTDNDAHDDSYSYEVDQDCALYYNDIKNNQSVVNKKPTVSKKSKKQKKKFDTIHEQDDFPSSTSVKNELVSSACQVPSPKIDTAIKKNDKVIQCDDMATKRDLKESSDEEIRSDALKIISMQTPSAINKPLERVKEQSIQFPSPEISQTINKNDKVLQYPTPQLPISTTTTAAIKTMVQTQTTSTETQQITTPLKDGLNAQKKKQEELKFMTPLMSNTNKNDDLNASIRSDDSNIIENGEKQEALQFKSPNKSVRFEDEDPNDSILQKQLRIYENLIQKVSPLQIDRVNLLENEVDERKIDDNYPKLRKFDADLSIFNDNHPVIDENKQTYYKGVLFKDNEVKFLTDDGPKLRKYDGNMNLLEQNKEPILIKTKQLQHFYNGASAWSKPFEIVQVIEKK